MMSGDTLSDVGDLTASACANLLEDNGWLESYRDTATVQILYRLTPTGKAFARLFWERNHPSAVTRNRHALLRRTAAYLPGVARCGGPHRRGGCLPEKVLEEFTVEIEQLRLRVRQALKRGAPAPARALGVRAVRCRDASARRSSPNSWPIPRCA